MSPASACPSPSEPPPPHLSEAQVRAHVLLVPHAAPQVVRALGAQVIAQ